MSNEIYDFGEIVDEALKGKTDLPSATGVRLEGTFKMLAKYASGDRKTKAGHPQISIVWQVQGGPDAETEVWQNVVFSPKSKAVAGRTLLALGVPPEFLKSISGPENFADGLLQIADALVGVEVELNIKPQPNNTNFDNYTVVELISGPVLGATPGHSPIPAAQRTKTQEALATQPQVAYPQAQAAVPSSVPGGFVPQV